MSHPPEWKNDWFARLTGFRECGYEETQRRLEVVGVAVFPHVVFENIHLPVCLLYLLPEFHSDRLLDFRLFNDCLLLFHDCG